MTAYDVRGRATAARLLNTIAGGGKGQAVILTRQAEGDYDTSTGTNALTTTTQTGSGVVFEYNTFIRSGVRNEPGSLIQAGDKQLILSALNSAGAALSPPKVNDQVTVGGVAYTITSLAPLGPAGTPVYYECNIRGAA